jgi:hypothetical protein
MQYDHVYEWMLIDPRDITSLDARAETSCGRFALSVDVWVPML